ncbi:hypothetical protein [Paraburkholderia tropica]|uniref:hypothetical protein n=1 Tax=Paraburkholderia tropica TaxID=92647 RepID=UPI002ABE2292|nr:hypothetical protein [Paraburkholderia tropica]
MSNKRTTTDRLSVIGDKSSQLVGLLNLCYGAGFESFSGLTEELQGATLELAAHLAAQINALASGVDHE